MPATDGPVLALGDVRRSFGPVRAVDGISLEVRPGEMFGVIGPDGAGKTTLLRLCCGLIAPDAGRIRLFGRDPFRDRRAAAASIGYLSQRFSLYGDLSIDENIEFAARIHGERNFDARRARLLDLTGLTPFRHRLAERLSGGMKQKLALACTLVHEPPLLILDEPTTGVDPVSRREFWKLLAEFLSAGLTIVLATPYLDEAERCSRVALVSGGRVLAIDRPVRLQSEFHGVLLEVVASPVREALEVARTIADVSGAQVFGDRLHVRADRLQAQETLRTRLESAGIAVADVRSISPSLEDVFIDLIGKGAAAAAAAPVSAE